VEELLFNKIYMQKWKSCCWSFSLITW